MDGLRVNSPEQWDVVVVGAGITGAGVARDAALRGLRVLVLEASDVAYGTSSRSSRLIHGGVRYLEQGDVGLVYEALRERRRLYDTAPHLIRRQQFLFPSYQGDRLPPWKLRAGLTAYDLLDLYRGRPHEYLTAQAATLREPLLTPAELRGAVLYEDAVTDDARLTLSVLQDARRVGAEVLTYTPVRSIAREGGRMVVRTDAYSIPCRACIVATGPWTGPSLIGRPGDRLLALSKGVHLVMRAADIPIRQPIVIQMRRQRRILFVVPWGNRTYLGTTDTAFEGDPGASGVTEEDEHEVLQIVSRVLRGARLERARIVSAWSGVRPLVRPAGGADDTVEVSRSHRVIVGDNGALAIVGGKLTTYRAMAEQVVDTAIARAGLTAKPCSTGNRPLVPGSPLEPRELAQNSLLADLHARHGPLARELIAKVHARPDLGDRLVGDLPYRWVEVDHSLRFEGCMHVDDVLRRRLPLVLTDPELGGRVARAVAERLVAAREGSAAEIDHELDRYRATVARETRRSVSA